MEGTRLAGSEPFMPRKPGQRARLAVQSAFWAAYSGQWEQTARHALIANAGPRGERPNRLAGGLTCIITLSSTEPNSEECQFFAVKAFDIV